MKVFSRRSQPAEVLLPRGRELVVSHLLEKNSRSIRNHFRASVPTGKNRPPFEITRAVHVTLDTHLAQLLQKSHPFPADMMTPDQHVRRDKVVTLEQLGIREELQYRGLGSLLKESFPYGVSQNRRFEMVPQDRSNLPTILELMDNIHEHHREGMLRDFIAPLCLDQSLQSLDPIPGFVDRFSLRLRYSDANGVVEPKDKDLVVYSNLSSVELAAHPEGILTAFMSGEVMNPAFRPVFTQLAEDYQALGTLFPSRRKIKFLVVLRHPVWSTLAETHQGYKKSRQGFFVGVARELEPGKIEHLAFLQNFPYEPNK